MLLKLCPPFFATYADRQILTERRLNDFAYNHIIKKRSSLRKKYSNEHSYSTETEIWWMRATILLIPQSEVNSLCLFITPNYLSLIISLERELSDLYCCRNRTQIYQLSAPVMKFSLRNLDPIKNIFANTTVKTALIGLMRIYIQIMIFLFLGQCQGTGI